ncbi:hypothetical protein [Mesorhizobium sp. M0006]|uniref:hypothetical protein n=1 Tax=Mesorhizobium sp. M0006 TaxID=2956838 RepID=UPI00333D7896
MQIINLKDLSRWAAMQPGEAISFNAGNPRTVRLRVNCQSYTAFYIAFGDAGERFLCSAPAGLSLIEFVTNSQPFKIGSDAADAVAYYTAELEQTAVESDAESFTKIAHRRARNPELEQMMFLMNQNMDRRLAQMDNDHSRQIAELRERGIENAEVLRTGGNLHVGAATQREELASEAAGEPEAAPVGERGAPRKGRGAAAGPAGGSADDSGEAGGEA